MANPDTAHTWRRYLESELEAVTPVLTQRGYTLDVKQPHTQGERFLMQNLTTTSGVKLILLGVTAEQQRVVIKATRDTAGKRELKHERRCRQSLHAINFAYQEFHSPDEVAFFEHDGFVVSVQEYIPQSSPFIERPLAEQFSFALNAFKTQESARATTRRHYRIISQVFGIRSSDAYRTLAHGFHTLIREHVSASLQADMDIAMMRLTNEKTRIEQYCGFLTHTDFVPHNFRIKGDTLYLLDFSSLQFGNKYESWARFLNFMTLYNHELETLLIEYIEHNRAPEERESLQLMRIYRLLEILAYYQNTLKRSEGSLAELNQSRVEFWHQVLKAELQNERVSRDIVTSYQETRDALRSKEEQERQKNLH